MKKLADISSFERLQANTNAGLVSDMSVFNGLCTEEILAKIRKYEEEEIAAGYNHPNGAVIDHLIEYDQDTIAGWMYKAMKDKVNFDDYTFKNLYALIWDECDDVLEAWAKENDSVTVDTSWINSKMADKFTADVLYKIMQGNHLQATGDESYSMVPEAANRKKTFTVGGSL